MGLNLALEASNNSQIVFSLREWEKKLRGRKGKKGPRLGQGTAQSYRVEAEGLSLAAVRYQMICRQGSGLVFYWLQREGLAAVIRPTDGFDSGSTLMLESACTAAVRYSTADKDSLTERYGALQAIAAIRYWH